MAMVVCRFVVYLVRLDPIEGHEIRKTRPCLVISRGERKVRQPTSQHGSQENFGAGNS